MATAITTASQFRTVKAASADNLVVIKCSTGWCIPCKKIAPHYELLVKKYPTVKFYTMDIDVVSEFDDSSEVTSVPTFLLNKNGWCGKVVGANINALDASVQKYK